MLRARKADLKKLLPLRKRAEFQAMTKQGRKWASQGLIVQTAPNNLGIRRVGYTVSKRVDKSAVVRNRIKRHLRAAAADVLPFFAADSHDYVLIGRAETAKRPYATLCEDLKWCLRKLNCAEKEEGLA